MRKFIFSLCCLFSASLLAAPTVLFETTLGNFEVELNQEKAPITVANFVRYVEDGSYQGTIFHRVIPGFMAQGGGFAADMTRKPTYAPIQNEANNGLGNEVASIAMARTSDPHSATRQFFINYADNQFLNYRSAAQPGYAVFGKVIAGFEVVEKMAQQPTTSKGRYQDVPETAIVINKVSIK